ncbi:unnamed protein product [Orchesella dallaii]|uniref:Uncharacterized protein n=1 Tax=Orchesella dallaii TaxID=48710 RepID=A0ABP1RNN7_9HEXA
MLCIVGIRNNICIHITSNQGYILYDKYSEQNVPLLVLVKYFFIHIAIIIIITHPISRVPLFSSSPRVVDDAIICFVASLNERTTGDFVFECKAHKKQIAFGLSGDGKKLLLPVAKQFQLFFLLQTVSQSEEVESANYITIF